VKIIVNIEEKLKMQKVYFCFTTLQGIGAAVFTVMVSDGCFRSHRIPQVLFQRLWASFLLSLAGVNRRASTRGLFNQGTGTKTKGLFKGQRLVNLQNLQGRGYQWKEYHGTPRHQ